MLRLALAESEYDIVVQSDAGARKSKTTIVLQTRDGMLHAV